MKIGSFSLVAILVISAGCTRERVDEHAMFTFMIGEVTRNNTAVQIGDIIREKDTIQTGAESFCDIRIGESLIRIKQKTTAVFSTLLKQGGLDNTTIDLDAGKMLCKPKKLIRSESFMVRTNTAIAGVRGTQFTVEADPGGTSRIKVFEGEVRVAKRVRELDGSIESILNAAPELKKDQKVVITKKDVEKVEKIVSRILREESAAGGTAGAERAIREAGKELVVRKKDITEFELRDFEKDNREIIEIKQKPAEVISEITRVIKEEKEDRNPNGRLLITAYEVYFIQNGKVEWEGTVTSEPVKRDDRLYIASGDYIFCASVDGPVIWRKQITTEGALEVRENELVVISRGVETRLSLKTGEKL